MARISLADSLWSLVPLPVSDPLPSLLAPIVLEIHPDTPEPFYLRFHCIIHSQIAHIHGLQEDKGEEKSCTETCGIQKHVAEELRKVKQKQKRQRGGHSPD